MTEALPLLLAIAGLFVGPVLYAVPHWRVWDKVLDGFAVAAVGGLCLFHLLPEAIETGGMWAVLWVIVGAAVPRLLHGLSGIGPWVMLGGLALHAAVESTALGGGHGHDSALGAAIVLHRLPVGLVVFALYREHFRGAWVAWVAVGGLALATAVGFGVGPALLSSLGPTLQGGLEALVAGMLFHIVWDHGLHAHGHFHEHLDQDADDHGHEHGHEPHEHGHEPHDHGHEPHDHGHEPHEHTPADPCCGPEPAPVDNGGPRVALATVAGLALVALVLRGGGHAGTEVFATAWSLAVETAPALVVAYLLAGVIHGLSTPATARWMAGGGRVGQAFRGVAFGLPLPICSCGVLPMYEALVRRGVPATAAMGFLIATPELGLDALLISVPLLGAELTVARLVAALLVALVVAWVVGPLVPVPEAPADEAAADRGPWTQRLAQGLRFGLVELVDHTLPWILVGLLIAAFAQPLLGHPLLTAVPPAAQVPLFALLGIPLYVCASGATPIAAVAIASGVGPGAALAFLLAGPATNITTFGVLSQLHGRRVAVAFGVAVTTAAIVAGWSVDALDPAVLAVLPDAAHDGVSVVQLGAMLALGALVLASLNRQGPRGMMGQITHPIHAH